MSKLNHTDSIKIVKHNTYICKYSYNPILLCTFASKINIFAMDALNRIKIDLVEQKKTGKWLPELLGVNVATTRC